MLAATEPLQARLFEEMKGRIKEDDASVPTPDGPFDYFSRYETGAQHPRRVRRPRGATEGETVLLDEDAEAAGQGLSTPSTRRATRPTTRSSPWPWTSRDRNITAIHVRDLATGEILDDGPRNAAGDFAFSPDSQWLFWVWRDENARPAKVFRRPARGGRGRAGL